MKPLALIWLAAMLASTAQGQDRVAIAAPDSQATDAGVSILNAAEAAPGVPPVNFGERAFASLAPPAPTEDAQEESAGEDYVHDAFKRGTWESGVIAGGGDGLGKSDNTQFMYGGARLGLVLTGEHLPGWLRGDFEWGLDVMPAFIVFPPQTAIYGGSFKPVIWQWNFTSKKTVAPYFAAVGGIIFTRQNIPPGDTSQVNFSPGATFGIHVFPKPRQALIFEFSIIHISNASLGDHNPGYNGSIFFTFGYTWYHGRH